MGARILVIEDNGPNLALMTYLLEAFGHTVIAAQDGDAGWRRLRQGGVDLAVCDIQLPGMDGYEIARQARRLPGLRRVPLVAVTALAMVGDEARIRAAGFDGYIAKPISPETFVAELEAFLPPRG